MTNLPEDGGYATFVVAIDEDATTCCDCLPVAAYYNDYEFFEFKSYLIIESSGYDWLAAAPDDVDCFCPIY